MTPDTQDESTGGFVERTAQAAHETIDQLQASASNVGDQLSDKAQAFSDLEYQVVEKVRDCVRDHPLASLLVAITAGVLIARLTLPSASTR